MFPEGSIVSGPLQPWPCIAYTDARQAVQHDNRRRFTEPTPSLYGSGRSAGERAKLRVVKQRVIAEPIEDCADIVAQLGTSSRASGSWVAARPALEKPPRQRERDCFGQDCPCSPREGRDACRYPMRWKRQHANAPMPGCLVTGRESRWLRASFSMINARASIVTHNAERKQSRGYFLGRAK